MTAAGALSVAVPEVEPLRARVLPAARVVLLASWMLPSEPLPFLLPAVRTMLPPFPFVAAPLPAVRVIPLAAPLLALGVVSASALPEAAVMLFRAVVLVMSPFAPEAAAPSAEREGVE